MKIKNTKKDNFIRDMRFLNRHLLLKPNLREQPSEIPYKAIECMSTDALHDEEKGPLVLFRLNREFLLQKKEQGKQIITATGDNATLIPYWYKVNKNADRIKRV